MMPHATTWLLAMVLVCLVRLEAKAKVMTEVDEFRYKFVNLEQELWNIVIDEQTNSISVKTTPELDLIKSYKQFGDELDLHNSKDITYGLKPLENLWIWARTYGELRGVYALYETFRRFQKLQTDPGRVPSPKQAWMDLADTIISDPKSSIPDALQKIHDLVKNERLFQESLKEIVFGHCDVNQSPQQMLFNLYNSIALTELKGYIMMQFSLQLLKLYKNQENYTEEAQLMRHQYQIRALLTVDSVKAAMKQTNRQLWKCDPKLHVKGETYTELTKLLQAYIENEIDLSPTTSCFKNCDYYDYAKTNGCYKNQFCNKQPKCRGKVLNCKYIDSDMWVCPASRNTDRRYEYIEYENGRILGRKMGCNRGTTKVDSWWRYVFWHCSYCICLCDDEDNSDRYFNLREYVSDVKNNKVVTGLKFIKVNRVIHLKIQEAELQPFGSINSTSLRWKAVDNYKITDRTVREGKDYHMLSWGKRDIDLDDLTLDSNHLVTGVRFRLVGTHLNLEIRSTPFDFKTGKVVQDEIKSFWHSNDYDPVSRSKLQLMSPDIPTRSNFPSRLDSKPNQFIEFTNSDYDRDAGQTTVPFIDTQDVVSEIAVPLSGAGICHKGQTNFGGFIAPKIITYDFSPYLGARFPEEPKYTPKILDVNVN